MENTRIKLIRNRWIDIVWLAVIATLCCVYLEPIIQKFVLLLQRIGDNWVVGFILSAYFLIPLAIGYFLNRIGGFRFKDFDFIYSFTNPPAWYSAMLGICSYPILSFYLNKPSYLDYPLFYSIIIFAVLLAIWTILGLVRRFWQKKTTEQNNETQRSGFAGDIGKFIEWLQKEKPIEGAKDDFFDSAIAARRIARALKQKPIKSISLFGPRGCGKTSILNLARNELREQKDKIIIYISAWGYEDKQLTSYIVKNTVKEISKYTDCLNLSFLPLEFQNIFLNSSWGMFDFLKFLLVFETPERLICRINKVLKRSNKKLIIFLEDIDRNQNSNVHHQLYSLFDYFSDVDSISFVVSYGGDI